MLYIRIDVARVYRNVLLLLLLLLPLYLLPNCSGSASLVLYRPPLGAIPHTPARSSCRSQPYQFVYFFLFPSSSSDVHSHNRSHCFCFIPRHHVRTVSFGYLSACHRLSPTLSLIRVRLLFRASSLVTPRLIRPSILVTATHIARHTVLHFSVDRTTL